jgi:uncharacterized protein YqeY
MPKKKEIMMLIEQIKLDQIEARKARSMLKATLLTTLLGEANMVAKNAQRDTPSDEEVQAVVRKFLKGNLETQAVLRNSGKASNGARGIAMAEQAILESYLPEQLSEDELKVIIRDAISGGVLPNVGNLMTFLKGFYAGHYDGKLASAVIKDALA